MTESGISTVDPTGPTGPAEDPRDDERVAFVPRRRHDGDRHAVSLLFLLSLVALLLGYVAGVEALRVAGAFGVLLFGVGTAPLQLLPELGWWTRLAVGGLIGLSLTGLVGTAMAMAGFWQPVAVGIAFTLAAVALHVVALLSTSWRRSARRGRAAAFRPRTILGRPALICVAVGTAIWLGAALAEGHLTPALWGFLPRISPAWYAGLALVVVGFVWARRARESDAAIAVYSLMFGVTLTPALVYDMPRAQSASKHVEFARTILAEHHVDPTDGIYHAYSGFFSAMAWMARLADVPDPTGMATYWPVILGVVHVAALRFLAGRVFGSTYRAWVVTALGLLVNALGGDYFSPQSVGYVVALVAYGLVLDRVPTRPPLPPAANWAILLLAGYALAPTHQLSPYVIGGVLLVLGVFGCARPRLACVFFIGPAMGWALINNEVVSGFISLSGLGSTSNFTPPKQGAAVGLERLSVVPVSSYALLAGLLVLIVGAGLGFLRNMGRRRTWAFAVCAGVGLVFVAVNPYGNEGIFRASLFGIPWLALLAGGAMAGTALRRVKPLALLAVLLVLGGTFVVAMFSMDGTSVERPGDVEASRLFMADAADGSYYMNIGFGDVAGPVPPPPASTARYFAAWEDVRPPDASVDTGALAARYERLAARDTPTQDGDLYALWSPTLQLYSRAYGLMTSQESFAWRDRLLADPAWQVAYEQGGTYLFRLPRGAG